MAKPAITLEVLPAAFGDCLLITCAGSRRDLRLLVDTGPDETYPALRARLQQIPKDAGGRRHIDLFVVTHIDHDHISAARLLLNDRDLGLSFGDIWFNAPPRPATRGAQRASAWRGSSGRVLPPCHGTWRGLASRCVPPPPPAVSS